MPRLHFKSVKIISFLACLGLFTIFFSLISKFPFRALESHASDPPSLSTPYSSFSIYQDSGLVAFPDKTGSGNETDPYVIRDLEIPIPYESFGIRITETTKHLHIINCTLTGNYTDSGLMFDNVRNVKVINCSISTRTANYGNIYLTECVNSSFINNTINAHWIPRTSDVYIGVTDGVAMINSTNITFHNNTISSNRMRGFNFRDSNNCKDIYLSNNNLIGCGIY
ncbi:MAG: right-handed parallel beta-helix repeat-containing protein, partial [Candidatus Hodarchaeota archaeon]